MNLSGFWQIWLDLFRKELDRIGSGSDLDPNVNLWIWIGSRSKFSHLDRIGSNSKKIGAEYITASAPQIVKPAHQEDQNEYRYAILYR